MRMVQQRLDRRIKDGGSGQDAHQGAITVAVFIDQPSLLRFNSLAQSVYRLARGPSNVEYLLPRCPMSLIKPADKQHPKAPGVESIFKAFDLHRIKELSLDQVPAG